MKIRIGDITIEQLDKMCNEHPLCDGCPLRGRTMCLSDEYDLEVEIPDELLEAAKNEN